VIRRAGLADASAIAQIFNQGVEDRVGTFQTWPSAASDFSSRVDGDAPLLVAESGGRAVAWAGVIPYSDRPFYSGVGEYQIYVERELRGRGIGARLLSDLAAAAAEAGYWKLLGKLFASNKASIALARRCGFRQVGVHMRHGRLDGEWRDVVVVERLLGEAA